MINDNFYPKNSLVVTAHDKEVFLKTLPQKVKIDPGIQMVVDIVNGMRYFLTQSSCEGENEGNPFSKHMPVPYITIGVLYEAYHLLDELLSFIWSEMRKKTQTISFDYEVQAINRDKKTGTNVPRFHKFLTIFLKNKRGIADLENVLKRFSERQFFIPSDVSEVEAQVVSKCNHSLSVINRLIQSRIIPATTPEIRRKATMDLIKSSLSTCSAVSNVQVKEERHPMHPSHYSIQFSLHGSSHNIDDLFKLLCSMLTGGIIVSQSFVPTITDSYIRQCRLFLLDSSKAELTAAIIDDWVQSGSWDIV
ncbi:hypothetical protein ACFVS2_26235 [Brevibacillus sp. NPDC058079]|uniref:hypothetical protein n=1 Tax=Brevibacillus sp. NPDC058079 TaxID=3346330 RepID=UPI0036F0FF7C